MSTIKVVHETVVRRFTLSPDSTFSNLESQLRNLFFIPSSIPITISYTDEEGDVITMSSDLELQEVISQQSAGHTIKLFLNTPTGYTHRIDNSKPAISNKDTEEISETRTEPELSPSSTYKHVGFADEEVEDQLYEFIADENNKEESEKQEPSIKEKEEKEKEKENNEDDGDEPHVIFMRVTRPPSYPYHCGPRFDLFGALQFGPYRFPSGYTFDCGNKNSCGYASSSGFNKSAGYYRTSPCSRTSGYGPRTGGCQGYRHFNQQFTSEQLAEKLKTLNSMGFVYDNAKYEDLLRRYHGHIGRVVDILLREQEESDRASSSKSEKQGSVEHEQETTQYSVPVMEVDPESRPYSL